MKPNVICLLLFVVTITGCISKQSAQKLTFLKTSGQDIINEKGEKIYLLGVGLGNWMLPEGYMWKFGGEGDRPRKIEQLIENLIGKEKADKFWNEFRKTYITEADIQKIAELGFNSVRPALNSRLFLTEGEKKEFKDEGFQLLDSLVKWCSKYNIYVIIDMHGAPGGQTGQNIDDSPENQPELFIKPENQDLLVKLWLKIVEKYKDEPTVAAYDLLNEPLPVVTGAADKYKHLLIPVYQKLITEIRKIDKKHMITLEGFDWSNNWELFDKPLDNNLFYQFHYYCWDNPSNLKSVQYFLNKRNELNTPIWVGETGEKENTIYWGTSQYFKANNIGFSFWPWKKMDTKNTPYAIKRPENWELISAYSEGNQKPDAAAAEKVLDEFLNNIKLANCQFYPEVSNAIFNRVPGKIESENYGHNGYLKSYFVKDTATKSQFYRLLEPVKIKLIGDGQKGELNEQYIELNESEWTVYQFNSLEPKKCQLSIKVAAEIVPTRISLQLNGNNSEFEVINKDWTEVTVSEVSLNAGENELKIKVTSNQIKIDWISFK
ncbi:MAG: cellulase family glycosylhydrolase [Bacteroidales bacterium]